MEKKAHTKSRFRSDPLQLKRLAGPLVVTVTLWAIVGAIAFPLMTGYFGMTSDHAMASLLVVLGSLTIVTRGLGALLARWNPPTPPEKSPRISGRTKILVLLTAISMTSAFLMAASLLAYVGFIALHFDWAVSLMGLITLGLLICSLGSFLAVPILVSGYWIIGQADRLQEAINQKVALSFTMAACIFAIPIHNLQQHHGGLRVLHSVSMRHH